MDMDYQKQMFGMKTARTLFLPITVGSSGEATIAMVLMPVCSTGTTTMAMPTATMVFVLRWWSMERKRLIL